MKPSLFWESLDTAERNNLEKKSGKSKKQLFNIFNGLSFMSIHAAVELSEHCDSLIDPLDLVSPENRKAVKVISGKK